MYRAPVMDSFAEPLLHVDMDAFFVEVERLSDATLIGVPVIVGGLGPRGVVASCSYEAREYGVSSAMPMTEARRRCPQARCVAPNHDRYGATSHEVFELLRSFTPVVESLSVDEGFLDVSGLRLHYARSVDVAVAIRSELRSQLGLPASVGVAASKFIAKMASADAKPDGLHVVPAGTERSYLAPLPVRRLWGVGQATQARLEALGITTIGELADLDDATAVGHLGNALGSHLVALARGEDDRGVDTTRGERSISVEETYPRDLVAAGDIERELLALCDRLANRVAAAQVRGHTVQLKVRTGDFTTMTRSTTVDVPVAATTELWSLVGELWVRVPEAPRGVRLLGVGVSGLVAAADPLQLTLGSEGGAAAASVVDDIRKRFGPDALKPARLVANRDQRPHQKMGQPPPVD